MDILFAIVWMGLLSAGTIVGVARLLGADETAKEPEETSSDDGSAKKFSNRTPATVIVFAVIIAFVFLFATKDRLTWAWIVPDSAAIIWTNLTVLALAVAAGAAFRLPNRPKWRQYFNAGALALLALATLLQPVLQPRLRPVAGSNQWDGHGVCIQSTPTTCSAAAAATMLKHHGIDQTESELVRLCLTDARGTPSLGMWRGLSLATKGTAMKPRVVSATVEDLLTTGPWPTVLVVGLPRRGADPIYIQQYGWDPGFRHSVVLFGRKEEGLIDIGDPAIGRETWSDDDLRVLWRGEAIELVPRD